MARFVTLILTLGICLVGGPFLSAQVTTGTFYGIVTDSTSAVIPNANVTFLNEGTGLTNSLTTDERGEFAFNFVPVGFYTLRIAATGFKTLENKRREVTAGQNIRQSFTLTVGQVTEKVSVEATVPLVNTINAEQQQNISNREVTALPVARRTVSNLMSLGSGVVDMGQGQFSYNGLGMSSTNLTMDGIDASSNAQAPQAQFKDANNYIAIVSLEAVQEIQMSKGVFSAEYARSLGGSINVITKSGTNTWHGSAFNLFNSEELNGRLQFLTTKPGTTFNQFGGSLGGPIWKNRAFIFGAYEGYRERSASVLQNTMPTPSLRAAMISAVPAYKQVLDFFPLPNQPYAANAATGNYIAPGSVSAGDDHFDLRPDIRFSDRALLTMTFVHARPTQVTPRAVPVNAQLFTGVSNRVNLNFTYIFGPRWSSETRVGYNRNDRSRNDGFYLSGLDTSAPETTPGGHRIPGIDALGFSVNGEYNQVGRAPHRSVDQKVSATIGRHSLKFGGLMFWDEFGNDNYAAPTVKYGNQADLLANIPNSIKVVFGTANGDGKGKLLGLFIQDDFRMKPSLTLNLGMRYDYFGHWVANGPGGKGAPPHIYNPADMTLPNFQFTTFRPVEDPYDSDPLNFGPHLGFAYNPGGHGKTVVRGGFATMFMGVNGEVGKSAVSQAVDQPLQYNLSKTDAQKLGLKYPLYNQDVLALVRGKTAGPSYPYIAVNMKASYAMTYTLTVERMLTSTLALETSAVGTRGVKLLNHNVYNSPDRVTGLPPNPNLGTIIDWFDNGDSSHYYGWQTTVRKRFSHGFMGNINHTWGKAISYNGGDIGRTMWNAPEFNLRSNKGRAGADIRHNFNADFVYQVPAWAGNRLAHTVLGGWQLSGIFSARTGTALQILQNNTLKNQRPDLIDPAHVYVKKGMQYLNPAAFALVPVSKVSGATVRLGTLGNGAIDGPGLWNLDASVRKGFRAAEKYKLELRTDWLSAFNHTSLSGVDTKPESATFGMYTGTSGARRVQVGMRFDF